MNTKFNLTSIKPLALISTLAVIFLIGSLTALIVLRYRPQLQPRPSASPQIANTPTPQPKLFKPAKLQQPIGFELEFAKIKPLLPYKTAAYSIEYVQSINAINGKIQRANNREEFVKTRQTAEAYLKSKGVINLCALNIFWLVPQNMDPKSLNPTDLLTTNCPASIKQINQLSSPKP